MPSPQPILSDADVHGLVDGRLDGDRRSEILRRLATSPGDRQRVEAWQDQNELIRDAFAGIDKEPVPVSLNVATPHVQAVPASIPPLLAEPHRRSFRPRNIASFAAMIVVLSGVGGLWLMLEPGDREGPRPSPRSAFADPLADRALSSKSAAGAPLLASLPTTEIPDLGAAGFAFESAEATASEPPALLFHYRNASAERLVISVSRAPGVASRGSSRTLSWSQGGKTYELASPIAFDQLRLVALLLQDGAEGATRH